ncbi:hypothetical protein F4604DRAFT_1674515 [Suillus subluteus]|nr:hypothetical protein F4604DRAFT_1674515 [Suillus subluteus]
MTSSTEPKAIAYHQDLPTPNDILNLYQADTHTALRTMPVHGRSFELSHPDDEELIWNGDLCWYHGDVDEHSYKDFDWLVDYLESDTNTDDETKGNTLLMLSTMQGLGSSFKKQSYINSLICCLHSTSPCCINAMGCQCTHPGWFSHAISTAVHPNDNEAIHDTGSDASFHEDRDYCYIRLIYALTQNVNSEWRQRLTRDGHPERYISLVDGVCQKGCLDVGFYLLVIFGCIRSSGKDLPFSPAEKRW